MLLNIIDSLEKKLEKFSSDNLKSMFCIHTDISNKPDLIIDDLSASTSHAFDSESDSIVIKLVIVDTSCLDNFEHNVSLFLLVIIVRRLVILDQIVIC